jgi:FlaA1/EpsC-like NDP-sugar epimerase
MRNRYILVLDALLIALCAFGAFALRLDLMFMHGEYRPAFLTFLAIALVVKPPLFIAFGLYSRYWRYASLNDLIAVALGVTGASVATAAVVATLSAADALGPFPRSVVLTDWILTLVCVGGLRASVRVIGETREHASPHALGSGRIRRVLIAGAGEAGTLTARELRRNPQLGMDPIGFLDDDRAKVGKRVQGLPVLGALIDLHDVVTKYKASDVVIAMPKVSGGVVRQVLDECRDLGIKAQALPGVFELLGGTVSVSRLREIEIADLLRREQVASDTMVPDYLAGQVVLVTGAGGSIGSELCRQVARAGARTLVLVGHGENSLFESEAALRRSHPATHVHTVVADVRDRDRLARVFALHRPSIVFHAAAHKHVPLMEAQPSEAVTNNVAGTRNTVELSLAYDVARFVLISTDKAVGPSSVMGATKRVAELIVRDVARRSGRPYVAVRFGNVLGSRGSVVPTFKDQIAAGGPIRITHPDMNRFFMSIPEAVHLVVQAGGIGGSGDLFVLNMGEPVKIVDLAKDLIRLSGLDPASFPIEFTGLRPGEKLYERLWEDGDVVEQTAAPNVLRVTDAAAEPPGLTQRVDDLLAMAGSGDHLGTVASLAQLVPTYVPMTYPLVDAR